MDATIVSVGDELVIGQIVDTNAAWLSTRLVEYGLKPIRHITVGDDIDRIIAALAYALSDSQLIIVTGGLGPTPDDRTRNALATVLGQPLQEHPGALKRLQEMFRQWHRSLSESNRMQAQVPLGCEFIPNNRGTACGIHYHSDSADLFALPGVPAEMRAMYAAAVAPIVAAESGGTVARVLTLSCFGRSEAAVGDLLADMMEPGRNPSVGTTASQGIIGIRLLAHGQTVAAVEAILEDAAASIRCKIGRAIFGEGDESLQYAVADALRRRRLTVAVAESCTGGLLAKSLTDVPGSSAYFLLGYVAYANQAKVDFLNVPAELIDREGAVSEEVARAMAVGCRNASGADLAVSITGIAGPGGGESPDKPVGLVFIGLADAAGVDVRRWLIGEHLSRDEIRDRSCKLALNILRLRLPDSETL